MEKKLQMTEEEFHESLQKSTYMGFKYGADCVLKCAASVLAPEVLQLLQEQVFKSEPYVQGAEVDQETKTRAKT